MVEWPCCYDPLRFSRCSYLIPIGCLQGFQSPPSLLLTSCSRVCCGTIHSVGPSHAAPLLGSCRCLYRQYYLDCRLSSAVCDGKLLADLAAHQVSAAVCRSTGSKGSVAGRFLPINFAFLKSAAVCSRVCLVRLASTCRSLPFDRQQRQCCRSFAAFQLCISSSAAVCSRICLDRRKARKQRHGESFRARIKLS